MSHRTRNGSIVRSLFISLVILAVLFAGGFYGWQQLVGSSRIDVAPQMVKVKKETFVHEILEKGNVESSINVDITCEVESLGGGGGGGGGGGVTIIKIVEEGTDVKKGDLLIEFDSSILSESVNKQTIAVLNSEARTFQSEVDLKNAQLELEEYREGKFKELLKAADNKILKQKEALRKAEDALRFNKNLLQRGYITESLVESEEFAFRQAENELAVAEMEKENLIKYTAVKTTNSLEAKVAAATAKVNSDQESLRLEKVRLAHLERQLGKCTVYAPQDGQVVYAPPRWGNDENIIREGLKVVERQQIIKLPDPTKMQVKGLINEASIRLVKPGDPAVIELEAFPNQSFNGVVRTVNEFPEPTGWNAVGMAREYQTIITITDPPPGIKPGLTAKVKIIVNVIPGALTLPIQAVFEYDKKMYCVTYNEGNWDKIEVKTGPTNDKQVVIESGLEEGDEVVLNAWMNRENLKLPKIDKEEEEYAGPLKNEYDNQGSEDARAPNADRPREGGPPREGGGPGSGRGDRAPRPASAEDITTEKPAETITDSTKETKEKPAEKPEKTVEVPVTPNEKNTAKTEE